MQIRGRKLATRLLDFYLFGNVHIALCAVALTLTTEALFRLSLRPEIFVFVFCGTFFAYNLLRLRSAFEIGGGDQGPTRNNWASHRRGLLTSISFLGAVAFGWSFFTLYLRSKIFVLIPAALSFAYAVPVIPARQKWSQLREIPRLKIFVIAIVWACSCALLPIVAGHHKREDWVSLAVGQWVVACGLLIFSLTIPFDIRDLKYDSGQLKTLPAWLGIRASIALAIVALALSSGLVWWSRDGLGLGTASQALAYSLWCSIAAVFVYQSSPERHEYYFSFAIDGLILLLWGMIWAAKLF